MSGYYYHSDGFTVSSQKVPEVPLLIRETSIDRDRNIMFYECENDLKYYNRETFYKELTKEFGRCVSKVYHDNITDENGCNVPIGWVFHKRKKYDDSKETFLCETWIGLVLIEQCQECGVYHKRSIPTKDFFKVWKESEVKNENAA